MSLPFSARARYTTPVAHRGVLGDLRHRAAEGTRDEDDLAHLRRTLTRFDTRQRWLAKPGSYTQDSEPLERGCAFINAAAELSADHPGYWVIRAHKQTVLSRLVELVGADHPGVEDAEAVADEVFLLLEGAIAHRGIDGDDRLVRSAREMTARLIHHHR